MLVSMVVRQATSSLTISFILFVSLVNSGTNCTEINIYFTPSALGCLICKLQQKTIAEKNKNGPTLICHKSFTVIRRLFLIFFMKLYRY